MQDNESTCSRSRAVAPPSVTDIVLATASSPSRAVRVCSTRRRGRDICVNPARESWAGQLAAHGHAATKIAAQASRRRVIRPAVRGPVVLVIPSHM